MEQERVVCALNFAGAIKAFDGIRQLGLQIEFCRGSRSGGVSRQHCRLVQLAS
jgi:hypothetical protein